MASSSIWKPDIRNEKTILIFEVTDFTDTIMMKMFARAPQVPEILEESRRANSYKIKGITTIDKFDSQPDHRFHRGMKKIFRFPARPHGQQPGEAGGATLPYEMSDTDCDPN